MPDFGFPSRPSLFSRTLRECRELYVDSGELIARSHPGLLTERGTDAASQVELMEDLHRGLVLKVYLEVVEADRRWSREERFHGEVLCHHLWGTWLSRDALRDTIKRASGESAGLKWEGLLGVFQQMEPLRGRVAEVETLVSRLGNLVARCDGDLNEREQAALRSIEQEVARVLRPMTLDEAAGVDESASVDRRGGRAGAEAEGGSPNGDPGGPSPPRGAVDLALKDIYSGERRRPAPTPNKPAASPRTDKKDRDTEEEKPTVEEALAELDRLIGLTGIKHEVRSLANFLTLQQRREAAGLPETDISLHMVFTGNPGTGKTTVARIVGRVFGALGVLEKGHLIETDRSGLVAEYAGQTGPKTNKKVDEALDGLLFIDEAYSLVAGESEDPYGREAAQTLLKRAEDDRHRLVVTLAGYPDEMETLLRSNPGLSSRFNRRLQFDDYTPEELCRIFGLMCEKNHYRLTPAGRLKVMLGMRTLHGRRDRHFGNGRTARNLFEHAVRRMANRLAGQAAATQEQLMTLEGADIEFREVEAAAFESLDEEQVQVHLTCPACEHSNDVPTRFLGKSVKCPKCGERFAADWGSLVAEEVAEEDDGAADSGVR